MILAGGVGSRMRPLTDDCPKPLLPVGPWTLVEHQLSALERAGVRRVVLSTGYRHEDFEPLVERCRAKGVDLTCVVEATPLGTGGGLREALRPLRDADVVVVVNGDLLTGHDLGAQVSALTAADAGVLACVHVREVDDARAYGSVVVGDRGQVVAFVEKSPTPPSSTVNAGTYVVRPGLLDEIPPAGAVSLEREVFPALVADATLVAHREDAYFLDVGTPAALVAANRDLLRAPWPGAAPTPRGEALVIDGARVSPSARLGGGSVVHPGAAVADGALLDGALILPGGRVGAGARVTRSVVGRDAVVPDGRRLTDGVLGSGEIAPA